MQNFKDPVQEFINRVHNSGQSGVKKNYLPASEENKWSIGDQVTIMLDPEHTDYSGQSGPVVAVDGGMVKVLISKGVATWFYCTDLRDATEADI